MTPRRLAQTSILALTLLALATASVSAPLHAVEPAAAPVPLLAHGHPVDWWFAFKFNAATFPECGGAARACPFGGEPHHYRSFGQQFAYASSETPTLRQGAGCAGDTTADPLGATFDEVYNGPYYFVVWNDQFYDDPPIPGCSKNCASPWGHSKGLLAWNDAGEGLVLQVSTPSWPAAGSKTTPRQQDGNTLGCIQDDNVMVSQHFFALRLAAGDLVAVLEALHNASVVTDPGNPQIVHNGGPAKVQELVAHLGVRSSSTAYATATLSTGVTLISKPSHLHVPPWQMVSAVLGGIPLRTATWWTTPAIEETTSSAPPSCCDSSLPNPGPVAIATTGHWGSTTFGLTGGLGPDFNHAKLGVSTSGDKHLSIFGDLNQQGTLDGPKCGSSQNGRGGLFFVVDDSALWRSLDTLIGGTPSGAGG